jgi:hypothetical protein
MRSAGTSVTKANKGDAIYYARHVTMSLYKRSGDDEGPAFERERAESQQAREAGPAGWERGQKSGAGEVGTAGTVRPRPK